MGLTENRQIAEATFLGAAIGDALGVPYEFLTREEVRKVFISEMIGENTGAAFLSQWNNFIPAGAFSDDTSMLIAAAGAIAEKGGEIDYRKIMQNFSDWWLKADFCSLDFAFGQGRTVGEAMKRFEWGREPLECGGTMVRDNGNGALMRILPFSLYAIFRKMGREETSAFIADASRLTHGHEISFMGCYIFTIFLEECLKSRDKGKALARVQAEDYSAFYAPETIDEYAMLLRQPSETWEEYQGMGSGYVADALKGALYSVMKSDGYEETVSTAVRLGLDTDTTACIAGQLAGALYGTEGIPQRWLDDLRKREELIALADRFAEAVTPGDEADFGSNSMLPDSKKAKGEFSRKRPFHYAWGMPPKEAAAARLAERLEIGTLDSGSGLFGPGHKSEPDRSKLTLIIGLGGSGLVALERTKALLERELSADYADRVRFIGIDASPKDLAAWRRTGAPAIDLATPEFRRSVFPAGKTEFFREFVPEDYCEYGLYNSRLTSRVRFYNWNGEKTGDGRLRSMIVSLFRNEWTDYGRSSVEIVIISALSDEIGSGIFLDVAAQARAACPADALTRVFGYFLLPGSDVESISSKAIRNEHCRNTFAALKELESFQNMSAEPGRREIFPSQDSDCEIILSNKTRLFDFPVLISGDRDAAVETIARILALTVRGEEGRFDLRFFWANSEAVRASLLSRQLMMSGGVLREGACPEDSHRYITVGHARAGIPKDIVIPNLLGRVMRKMHTSPIFPDRGNPGMASFCHIFESLLDYYTEAGRPLDEADGSGFAAPSGGTNFVNICADDRALEWIRDRIDRKVQSIDAASALDALTKNYLLDPETWVGEDLYAARRRFDDLMGNICGIGAWAADSDELGLTVSDYYTEVLRNLPQEEVRGEIKRRVEDLLSRLLEAARPALRLRPGQEGFAGRVILMPERLVSGPYGYHIESAMRNAIGDGTDLIVSKGTEEIECVWTAMAIGLCDVADLDRWEDGYEAAATPTMHRDNGEMVRLDLDTGASQYKELTKSGTDRIKGISSDTELGDEEEVIFGTGLSWLHYPSVNVRRCLDPSGSRADTAENKYLREVFDRKVDRALELKIIECERRGDNYKYFLNTIPSDWKNLSVEDYSETDSDGACVRGKPLFDYLKSRNCFALKPWRVQIALADSPAFGPEGFDFSEVAGLETWPEERITETHRKYMKRILRRAVGLYQTLEDTLYRYYAVEQAVKERERILTEKVRADRFVNLFACGMVKPDEDLTDWTVLRAEDGARETLVTFSRRYRMSMCDLQQSLFKDGLRLAIVFDRYCALLDEGTLDQCGLERLRMEKVEKMSDKQFDAVLDERLPILEGEMKAFTERFGDQEDWTEAILRIYDLKNKEAPSARRVAVLYQAVNQALRDLE